MARFGLGERHTCALTNLGSGKCWGNNQDGQLGAGFPIGESRSGFSCSSTAVDVAGFEDKVGGIAELPGIEGTPLEVDSWKQRRRGGGHCGGGSGGRGCGGRCGVVREAAAADALAADCSLTKGDRPVARSS